ncbi:hypothetical protein JYU14_04325, partial [Simkania negevensis]|nr:hypothetical protein [Simkania negevensis]
CQTQALRINGKERNNKSRKKNNASVVPAVSVVPILHPPRLFAQQPHTSKQPITASIKEPITTK